MKSYSFKDDRLSFKGVAKFIWYLYFRSIGDTDEIDGKDIFKKLDERKTKDFIRHIDPEAYYPVYGDDSTLQLKCAISFFTLLAYLYHHFFHLKILIQNDFLNRGKMAIFLLCSG